MTRYREEGEASRKIRDLLERFTNTVVHVELYSDCHIDQIPQDEFDAASASLRAVLPADFNFRVALLYCAVKELAESVNQVNRYRRRGWRCRS
jgi:hypothetical protein